MLPPQESELLPPEVSSFQALQLSALVDEATLSIYYARTGLE